MEISEILFHLGENHEEYFNAVSPPIIQSSNFIFKDVNDFRKKIENELDNHVYSRGNNPTVNILRQKVAALEHTEDALIVGSGSSAVAISVLSQVNTGDHILCVNAPYSWTKVLLTKLLPRFGITTTFVDGTNILNIQNAIQPNTKVLYLESPNSITFELQDLKACAELAKANDIVTIIDNSYCTPLYQNPADFGIDIIIHSGTKYLNGHSDVVVGTICASKKIIRQIFENEYMTFGTIISPNDASLVIRGLRTLDIRLKKSDETAQKVIQYLKNHPKTKKIYYPFDNEFPQYELAKKQMKGCSGLFSIEFDFDTIEQSESFFHNLTKFKFAVSWGGHESLIFPTCALYNINGRTNPPLPHNFYRFYIGLEDADYLIDDIKKALMTY
jgi:cystathionine beta-lyase